MAPLQSDEARFSINIRCSFLSLISIYLFRISKGIGMTTPASRNSVRRKEQFEQESAFVAILGGMDDPEIDLGSTWRLV